MNTPLTTPNPALQMPRIQRDFILLDGSSSMTDKWWDSIAAIQAYVEQLRTDNVNSHLTLTVFDSFDREYVARDQPIGLWNPDLSDVGMHGGSTPLYDAIQLAGRKLRDLDPPRCSVLIVTDGDENGSRFTTDVQAKAILDWMKAKGWQVTFIGCDFDNSSEARKLGVGREAAIGVHKRLLTSAVEALARKRQAYGLYGTPMHYTDGEQAQFGGFLAAPKASGGSDANG